MILNKFTNIKVGQLTFIINKPIILVVVLIDERYEGVFMKILLFVIFISSLISIQNSNARLADSQFCNEWANFVDAYDMIPQLEKKLPYGMINGDTVKGAMSIGDSNIVFVPEPSESLLKSWPNDESKNKLVNTLAAYYESKKDYNAKVALIYKGKEINEAIKILKSGKLKTEEDRIINLAAQLKKISLGDSLTPPITSNCFNAYQRLSQERIKERNFLEHKFAVAIRSLNDDLQNCQMGSKISDSSRHNVKTIVEIVDQIWEKENSESVQPK